MKFLEAVASYLPSVVVAHVAGMEAAAMEPPFRQTLDTVCLFADVSGFTKLSEAMAKKFGPEGAEFVAKHLNSYFCQMIRIISGEGGDIFKFAGDAVIVLWPDVGEMSERARHAAQCALNVQGLLDAAELEDDVSLSVKIGVGVGAVSVLHLGGENGRLEYVAVGAPLMQAFNCEHHGTSGEVLLSKETFDLVGEHFAVQEVRDGGIRLISGVKPGHVLRRRNIRNLVDTDEDGAGGGGAHVDEDSLVSHLLPYVPGAIQSVLSADDPDLEQWGDELRQLTVIFVNLGLRDHDLLAASDYEGALLRCHHALVAVQGAVYRFEGTVNKFLMDDKGSTLIAVWGLPPHAHEDDPTRACLAGIALCAALSDLGLAGSVGITTGVAFCGVVGTRTRREYSVLGDMVNLSARLMQLACTMNGGVVCDSTTVHLARRGLEFEQLVSVKVKGKADLIDVFHPYTELAPDSSRGMGVHVTFNSILDKQLAALERTKLHFAKSGVGLPPVEQTPSTILIGVPCEAASWKRDAPRSFSLAAELPAGWRTLSPAIVLDAETMDTAALVEAANGAIRSSPEMASAFVASKAEEAANPRGVPVLDDVEWQILGTDIFLPWSRVKKCSLEWLFTLLRDTPPPSLEISAELILVPVPKAQRRWRQSHYDLAKQKIVGAHFTVCAPSGEGCCLLVEGPSGSGKTHFASACIAIFESLGRVRVGSGCGSAYDDEAFAPWRAVCTQWLDELGMVAAGSDTEEEPPSAELRAKALRRLLGPAIGTELVPLLPLLNSIASTALPSTAMTRALSVDEQTGTTRILVLALVRALTSGSVAGDDARPTFVFLDDAQRLDDDSWELCLDISTNGASLAERNVSLPKSALAYERAYQADRAAAAGGLPVVLVLMMRPPAECYANAANETPIPPALLELQRGASTHSLILAPMHAERVQGLLLERADMALTMGGGVWNPDPNAAGASGGGGGGEKPKRGPSRRRSVVPGGALRNVASESGTAPIKREIVAFATAHAHGNMQRGIDLLETMRLRPSKVPALEITPGASARAILTAARETDVSKLPFPIPMYGTLGSRLDCATVCGQIVLKVASMLGGQFKLSQLRAAWPLPRLQPSLEREIMGLVDLDLLKCIRLKPEPEFAFIDVWDKLTVERRLTSKQRAHVDRKKAREELEHQKEVRRKMYEATKSLGVATNVKGACLAMMVDAETNNKRRRASAHTNLLSQIKSLGRLVNDWKKVRFTVEDDLLILTGDGGRRNSSPLHGGVPKSTLSESLWAMSLKKCHLVSSNEYHHHKHIIEITSGSAWKKGEEQSGVHLAYISLADNEERDDLLYKLQFVLESIEMREADAAGALATKLSVVDVSEVDDEDDDEEDETTASVTITVNAARELDRLHPLELQHAYASVTIEAIGEDDVSLKNVFKVCTAVDGQVTADLTVHNWAQEFTVPKLSAAQVHSGVAVITVKQLRSTTSDGVFGSVRVPLGSLVESGESSLAPQWTPLAGKRGRKGGEVELKVALSLKANFAAAYADAGAAAEQRVAELDAKLAEQLARAEDDAALAVPGGGASSRPGTSAAEKTASERWSSIGGLIRRSSALEARGDSQRIASARAWAARRLAVVRGGGVVEEADLLVLLQALGSAGGST